ncbi:MAG TPA: transposase [Longimicrobiales bacterium]|nr:transposase [Longimicrobiales bacterium]
MPRQQRAYFPGGFFHVTARTQGKIAWFDEAMRDHICDAIALVQKRSDTRVVAFVIMPNHLHLVLQQRDLPISRFMHPLLCRIAAAVKKKHSAEGHVFERRYWDHPCMSPDYLHSCIGYVHNNPVKAGLTLDAAAYRWSSYSAYMRDYQHGPIVVEPLFEALHPQSPAPAMLSPLYQPGRRSQRDLGDVVNHVLRQFDPPIDVDLLRNMRGRRAARVRRACIRHAALTGYRNCQIARFLKVSDSVVSKVVVVLRENQVIREACAVGPKSEGDKQVRKK